MLVRISSVAGQHAAERVPLGTELLFSSVYDPVGLFCDP